MKKYLKSVTAILLVAIMCMSLCSCNIFKTMRENALQASMKEILDSPDNEKVIESLNAFIKNSTEKALSANENISYSVNDISVTKDGEKAGLLAASAKQIKSLIMQGKPGSSSRDIDSSDIGLLSVLNDISAKSVDITRNMTSEKLTDEKGNSITNENSEEITTEFVSDNILHLILNFFDTEVTETVTDEDGNNEEVTAVLGLEDKEIEKVFGEKADKEAVISEFDVVSDYIKVEDYSIEYTDCKISSDLSLDEEIINFVKFDKNMNITAKVTGTGLLADYGEITVSFRLTKTINYSFSYAAEE